MKKQVYVFDEYISSQKNGIGSFLREFLYCMKRPDVDICTLTFNANVKEFVIQIEKDDGLKRMLFPAFSIGEFTNNAEIVIKFLRLYISDSLDNIFFINHSPCEKLVEILKRDFPLSKVVFTIHDLGWTSKCMGDVNEYKKIVEKRDDVGEEAKSVLDLYTKEIKTYELTDRIVCLSEDTYNLLKITYLVNSAKMFLIPNGLRESEDKMLSCSKKKLRKDLFIPANEKVILYVGRPTKQKGMYALLNAFHAVLRKDLNVRLVVIGSDNSNRIENLINISSGFATHVSFLGLINKEELKKWYSVADIGVIPSYYEQCPYAGIEMMMHGLPIVASDGFGIRNMFQEGVNALVAPIGNRESSEEFSDNLAEALEKLLSSEELRKTLGRNAREVYLHKYSINQMRKGYDNLLI